LLYVGRQGSTSSDAANVAVSTAGVFDARLLTRGRTPKVADGSCSLKGQHRSGARQRELIYDLVAAATVLRSRPPRCFSGHTLHRALV